jgi:hypothetical protein
MTEMAMRKSGFRTGSGTIAAALAIVLAYGSLGLAQSTGQAPPDQARQARIADLKSKIANLQGQLKKTEAEAKGTNPEGSYKGTNPETNYSATSNRVGCCGGASGRMPASTHSSHHPAGAIAQAGGEHPMGGGGMGGMGGGGMMGGAGASPAASPGSESSPAPAASPSPEGMEGHMHGMEGNMGEGMGGMGGSAQPQASPDGGMGGGMHNDI